MGVVGGSALAADMPVKAAPHAAPAFNWTGWYVGANAGYQWSSTFFDVTGVAGASTSGAMPKGFSIGVQGGYRYQFANRLVLGAEVREFLVSGSEKDSQIGGFANSGRLKTASGGDLRATLGYAYDRWLPYVAAGLAWSRLEGCTTAGVGGPCAGAGASFSGTRTGTAIGAGFAYAFSQNVIGSLDYAHSFFGTKTYSTPGVGAGLTAVKLNTDAIRAALSYKF